MALVLFGVVLAGEICSLLTIAISIFFPEHRIWPPPKRDSWQQKVNGPLTAIVVFGVPLVGILDFESLGYGHWSRFLVGAALFIIGLGITIWGARTLGLKQAGGEKGKLITNGPYRYTRNPQYVGFILLYIGIILITSSFMALVTGVFAIFQIFIGPFTEEPWLRQQYGKPYEEYCKIVPRFIGFRSFKPAIRK
jgi:protein-S-isoprenylcysteine O-methyltransferase Ste14